MKRSVITPPYLFQDNQINTKLTEMITKKTVAKDVCNSLIRDDEIIIILLQSIFLI